MRDLHRLAMMWFVKVELRSQRDDRIRINLLVGHEVVLLDVLKVDSRFDGRLLKHVLGEALQIGIVENSLLVAFEVSHVHGIEADQGCKQTNVGQGDLVSEQEPLKSIRGSRTTE